MNMLKNIKNVAKAKLGKLQGESRSHAFMPEVPNEHGQTSQTLNLKTHILMSHSVYSKLVTKHNILPNIQQSNLKQPEDS